MNTLPDFFRRHLLPLVGASMLLAPAVALADPPPPPPPGAHHHHHHQRPAVGSYVQDVPPGYTEQTIGAYTYRIYDGLYYRWSKSHNMYQVLDKPLGPPGAPVPPPPPPPAPRPAVGTWVKDVPPGFTEQVIGNHVYRIHGGLYYMWSSHKNMYFVMDKPMGPPQGFVYAPPPGYAAPPGHHHAPPPPPPPAGPAVGSWVRDTPRRFIAKRINGEQYRLADGLYYRYDPARRMYEVLAAPARPAYGSWVRMPPMGARTKFVNGRSYKFIDGIYYLQDPRTRQYQILEQPLPPPPPKIGSFVKNTPPGAQEQTIHGVVYRVHEGRYYMWDAMRRKYKVLGEPLPLPAVGSYVKDTPIGYQEQTIHGKVYRVHEGLYYLWDAPRRKYKVLAAPLPPPPPPPIGSYVKDVPAGYQEQAIHGNTYRVYGGLYYLWDAPRRKYKVLAEPLPPPPPPPPPRRVPPPPPVRR